MQLFSLLNYKILFLTVVSTLSDMASIVLLFPTLKILLGSASPLLESIFRWIDLELTVIVVCLLEIVLILTAGITKIILLKTIATSTEEIRKDITQRALKAVYNWNLEDFRKTGATDITRTILSETDVFVANSVNPTYTLYLHYFTIFISLIILFVTDPFSVIVGGGVFFVILAALFAFVSKNLNHLSTKREDLNRRRFQYVTDRVEAFEDQHFYPYLSKGDERLHNILSSFASTNSSLQLISQIAKPTFELIVFMILIIVSFALSTVNTNILSDEKLVAIAVALYRLLPGVSGIYQARSQFKIGAESKRVIEQLIMNSVEYYTKDMPQTIINISCSGVIMKRGNRLIKAPLLELQKSKITLLKGPSGCGKSSFLHVILGLSHHSKGTIKVNGAEGNLFLNINWFNHVSYVGQKPSFVGNKVRENFTEGDLAKLQDVLLSFGLMNYFENFENLLEFNIDELSGGQLQKIAIARACIKDSQVLVLDEAMNAQDPISLENIMSYFRTQNRIILLVSHENGIESFCDEVVEFN